MKLLLERNPSHLTCTTGSLSIDGVFECSTLEDVVREIAGVPVERWKVKGKTAIPAGTYALLLTFSNRFQKVMPQLMDVPGFEGVRIHTGNTNHDTEGCILVGDLVGPGGESILQSRAAYGRLLPKIEQAITRAEPITLEIRNAF